MKPIKTQSIKQILKTQSIKQILKTHKRTDIKSVKKLRFSGVGKRDVYNITAPFKFKRTTYILGRIEPREVTAGSQIMFFKKKKGSRYWHPDEKCPVFDLEDPFITKINNMYVLGGIEIKMKEKGPLKWRTIFYKGSDIHNLKKFAQGPWGMKDIRLIQLSNKKIGVFTRPQGKKGGLGQIGFTIIDSLQQLKPQIISRAPIIPGQFARGEWGGVNEAHLLKNNKIFVLGHIATFSDKNKFYYPLTFEFDIKTKKISKLKILFTRKDLPKGESKTPGLYNVVFPGGIRKNKIYAGVGDAESWEITIKNPFN